MFFVVTRSYTVFLQIKLEVANKEQRISKIQAILKYNESQIKAKDNNKQSKIDVYLVKKIGSVKR